MTDTEVTMKTIDTTEIEKGHLMAFVYYTKVTDVKDNGSRLEVADLDNNEEPMYVTGQHLVERSYSADLYQEEVKENKTKVAEILTKSEGKPFTVCFDKQDGEKRVLRGRIIKPEPFLGRSKVEDLDIDPSQHRFRQVDHRTLHWLILDGIKYVVK